MFADRSRSCQAEVWQGLAVTLAERAFRRLATRLGDPQSQQAVSGSQCRELILGVWRFSLFPT